ncbi:glycosyltransferase family 4 protein [Methylophaga sp.]|uniref:glycosyltransferase family 4 protein n=1 Tax=Methylophaga sp. TaxID=2024840 RepID=UPI003A8E60CD
MARPRILIITRNLPPLVGGMERLNWHMADELTKYADVQVIGPRGAKALKPENASLLEAPLKPLPIFLLVAFSKGLWSIFRQKPDVILAGSGLTAPIIWLLSKLCSARSAAYLHGFDITVNHPLYRRLWRPTFAKLDSVVVNSTPTRELAVASGVSENIIGIVHPGVWLPSSPQPEKDIAEFKAKHGLTGKKILLSVGRLTTRKGLREFVEHALPSVVKEEPTAMLVVIGEAPKNSLGAGVQSEESIKAQARKSGVANHIKFLGVMTDKKQLATAYESADIHVFPVRHIPNDPEGFGMVAIEAAAHGIPTIAFATGGVTDAVSEEVSGHLVEQNNYSALNLKITRTLRTPMARSNIQTFSLSFSWKNFGEQLLRHLPLRSP